MSAQALVVPTSVEVLVVNAGVAARDGDLRWWTFNYSALDDYLSPEPLVPGTNQTDGMTNAGAYVHWTIPDALRHGVQDAKTGAVAYPPVPNRWLVVRTSATTPAATTGWIVESDCPVYEGSNPAYTSAYATGVPAGTAAPPSSVYSSIYPVDARILAMWQNSPDPVRNTFALADAANVPVAQIGMTFPLATWSERDPGATFLTAVAPANVHFAAYLPHSFGMFSLFDPLYGIDSDATLSYTVVGWYSDPSADVLAAGSAAAGLLDGLNWTLPPGTTDAVTRSLFAGGVSNVAWDRNGDPPSPDPLEASRQTGELNVALGNTTIDAFTSLVAQQVHDPATVELLRALNYDLLPVLNDANGDALLQERIRREWFGPENAGHSWTIVEKSSDGTTETALTAAEAEWLRQLNVDQATLDADLAQLFAQQWQLNEVWLKLGYLSDANNVYPDPPHGVPVASDGSGNVDPAFIAELTNALDPNVAGSLAAQVVAQLGAVKDGLAKVPAPDWTQTTNRQQAFLNGIDAFAAGKELDTAKRLKAVSAPRYWRANNPVVVISGVASPYEADPNAAGDVSLVPGGTTSAAIPALALANAPDGIGPAIDAVVQGLAQAWQQPWEPLFMEWGVQFAPIPAQSAGSDTWTFDGTDYHFTGSGVKTTAVPVSGVSLLSPHAQFVFGSRLKKFVDTFASNKTATETELQSIADEIAKIYDWNFLAQELVGFNEMLALRDVRAFRRPLPSDPAGTSQYRLTDLIGFDDGPASGPDALPDGLRGRVDTAPWIPNGKPNPFEGIRQGQAWISDLNLYDRFGRRLWLISSGSSSGLYDSTNFPALIDPALLPQQTVAAAEGVKAVAEFPPRPLQHARLDVQLVDKRDDSKLLGLDANVCPICAWLLPNHLDSSILLYAPDGTNLGEMRLTTDGKTRTATWAKPPHGSVTTLDDLAKVSAHLYDMVTSPAFATEEAFTAFLGAIDETLWTIDPLGARADQNLSVLIGRPLALVRARLQLQLDGPPIADTSWAATFATGSPDYLSQQFKIRLGDQATRQDGTIGYFTGVDYDTFNSVAAPDATITQNYVQQIGPLGSGQNYLKLPFAENMYQFVTLLADPRASVHATTGILPVLEIRVPASFVEGPLSRMEVGFRMGPILTTQQPTPAQGNVTPPFVNAITYPLPAEQNGAWSWWERVSAPSGDTWNGYDLIAATTTAELTSESVLRDGIFQFELDMEHQE